MQTKPINKLLNIYKEHDNKNYQVVNVLSDLTFCAHSKNLLLEFLNVISLEEVSISPYNRSITISEKGQWPYISHSIGSKQVYKVFQNNNQLRTLDKVYADKIALLNLVSPTTLNTNYPFFNNPCDTDVIHQLFQFNTLSKLIDFKKQNNYPKKFYALYILSLVHIREVLINDGSSHHTDIDNTNYIKNVIVFKSRGKLTGTLKELENRSYLVIPPEGVELNDEYLLTNEVDYYYYLSEGMTSQYQSYS